MQLNAPPTPYPRSLHGWYLGYEDRRSVLSLWVPVLSVLASRIVVVLALALAGAVAGADSVALQAVSHNVFAAPSAATAGVSGPEIWSLIISSFLVAGFVLRRRRLRPA
jgi:hypothetical protein